MIKRINSLKEVGRFSLLKSTNGSEGEFAKLNIIYALNACGKSTLCDVFRSLNTGNPDYITGRKRLGSNAQQEIFVLLESGKISRFQGCQWHDRESCPPIHVYDERFVAENVFIGHHISIEQRRNLYGLLIGGQAIALQQAVECAEQQLNDATPALNTHELNLSRLIPKNYTIDSFKEVLKIDDVDYRIEEAERALKNAEQSKAKADAIRARHLLIALPIATVPEALTRALRSTLDTVALAAEDKIRKHLASTSNGLPINWIKQGFESQTGTNCPHCGQDMRNLDIFAAYRSFFSGELKSQEQLLKSIMSSVISSFGDVAQNQLRQCFTSHRVEEDWWKDVAGFEFELRHVDNVDSLLTTMQNIYQAITASLERKQASPGREVSLTAEESSAITFWENTICALKQYNEALSSINNEIRSRQTSVGAIDLASLKVQIENLTASKKRHEQETIDAYIAYDAAVSQKTAAQQNKQKANESLRRQSSQIFERYGKKINDVLAHFSVDFRIASDGVNFRGGQPSGQLAVELRGVRVPATPEAASDPSQFSLANTLSGGDRSALALAFFLAKVEMAPDVENSVVVFDDPYHNQDRSRCQCTIEKIQSLTRLTKQCFVFSHDIEFARMVEKSPNTAVKTFLLQPCANIVTLEACPLPLPPSQAYLKNYYLLDSYSESPASHILRIKEVAGTLRLTLEDHLRLKYPKAFETNDWLGDMIRKIREAEATSPLFHYQQLAEELGNINTYSQRFHHGTGGAITSEPDPSELKTYVVRTLKIIHAGGSI